MPPSPPIVPGAYNFARRAWFDGLSATGSVVGDVELVEPPAETLVSIAVIQRRLSAHVRRNLDGTAGAIAATLASGDRGAIPEYDNQWNNAGWEGWLTYHPADNPQRLDKPLAIVHSESAAIPQGVRTFLNGFAGDATMQWLEGVTQFDFYDNPEDVERAADTVATHFRAEIES